MIRAATFQQIQIGFLFHFALTLHIQVSAAWCGRCANAPSRWWSYWFGFGKCECEPGWFGQCCDNWSVSDWKAKVADWRRGKSCEAQPENACKLSSNPPRKAKEAKQVWEYEPSSFTQRKCEDKKDCIWVECFQGSGNSLPVASGNPDVMCFQCGGQWQDKCEWKSYTPGWLAFAGPGKHCGFNYPLCPAGEGKNCFCGKAADKVKEGWCNNGAGLQTFCPKAMKHVDNRTQNCSWSGWTIAPQASGGMNEDCKAWGLTTGRLYAVGQPVANAHDARWVISISAIAVAAFSVVGIVVYRRASQTLAFNYLLDAVDEAHDVE